MINWISVKDQTPPFRTPILVHLGYESEQRTVGFDVVAIARASPNDESYQDEHDEWSGSPDDYNDFQFYLIPSGQFWMGLDVVDGDDSHCLDLYSDAITHWAPLPNQPEGFTKQTYW